MISESQTLSWRTSQGPSFCIANESLATWPHLWFLSNPLLGCCLPGSLLKQATSTVGDLLVLAAVLFGVNLALAELLLSGIET